MAHTTSIVQRGPGALAKPRVRSNERAAKGLGKT